MAKANQPELKETMQLGYVFAVIASLCSDDAFRLFIRPIPYALRVVAAILFSL
jgi:hypothetical protein